MRTAARLSLAMLLVVSVVPAQLVYIDNNSPTTGTSNAFPWAQAGGFATLHVYTAAQLAAGGVCPGAVLTDVAVAPSSGTAGTYNAPQARLSVGHLAVNPPVAGQWEANIANPTVVHDLTSGPYSFPWTLNTWTPLPGFAAAGFVWDGVTDIAIYYTSSSGVTGTFSARRTATNLRHAGAFFNPTNQLPTSNGNFAMKVRLTFTGGNGAYQANQPHAGLSVDLVESFPCLPALVTRGLTVPSTVSVASTSIGQGFDIALTIPEALVPLGGGALQLPGSGQIANINLAAPSLTFLNALLFPPFPGNFTAPFASGVPLVISAQLVIYDPTNADGFALSGGIQITVQ